MRISRSALIAIIATALAFQMPALVLGGGGYDYIFHMVWSKNFAQQFWGGELYPRWMMEMNAGCGGPDFFFYSPIAFYLNNLFYPLNGLQPEGWYPLLLSVFVILILSGISFYQWIRNHLEEYPALFASVMYLISPYYIYGNYMRFAFTETLTFVWLPLLLHLAQKIISGKKHYWPWFSIVYALQIMSNIPGTIIVSCLIAAYFFYFAKKDFYLKGGAIIAAAVVLACGIAAIYLLPIATFYSSVQLGGNAEVNSMFVYTKKFLFNINQNGGFSVDTDDIFLLVLTAVILLNFIATVLLWRAFLKKTKDKTRRRAANFWMLAGFLALFMMLPYSSFLYETFPVLQLVRHPIRFGMIHAASVAVLLGYLVSAIRLTKENRSKIAWNFAAGVICIIIPLSYMLLINSRRPFDQPPLTTKDQHIQKYHSLNMVLMHEYIPANTDIKFVLPKGLDSLADICSRQTRLISGKARAEVTKWEPRDIELKVTASSDSVLEVGQFWFPAWAAESEDGSRKYNISPSKKRAGVIAMEIPEGEHEISLRMEKSAAERNGFLISILSIFTAIIFLKFFRRKF